MEKKSLGVIGGMGPKATSVFFEKVVDNTVAHKDQDHINMIILNHATLPDRTDVILKNQGEVFLNAISSDLKLLEYAGVANIAIPCNTSHYFYDELVKMTSVNIINMVDETMKEIYVKYGEHSKVGILATNGTIKSGIYKKASEKYKLNLHIPNEFQQEQVMDIIYNHVKSDADVNPVGIESLIEHMVIKEKCDCVILACTELSCIQLNKNIATFCIDAMQVLVNKSIEMSNKQIKEPTPTF